MKKVNRGHRSHHRQISAEDAQCCISALRIVFGVRRGTLAGRAHALDVDVDELAQLGY
jgi:hypothetical protein